MTERRRGGRPRRAEDRWTDSNGYVMLRAGDHIVPEHRLVMMAHLGRPLLPGEQVRFRNGNRGDTRIENLELAVRPPRFGSDPSSMICPHCLRPWLDPDEVHLEVPVDEARERVARGEWPLDPREAAREFPAPFEKPLQGGAA